jgi:predicted DNA-binding transcriptional regulator YafY
MQIQRLKRLMNIISDIKHNPASNPDCLCACFAISRRQFYKDRDLLAAMGFGFHFSRKQNRLLLDKEPAETAPDGIFALLEAARSLINQDNLFAFMAAWETLQGLLALLPPRLNKIFQHGLQTLLLEEGLACSLENFNQLRASLRHGRRIVVLLKGETSPLMLAPRELTLEQGVLYLLSDTLSASHPLAVILKNREYPALAARHIRKVAVTPFFAAS